MLLHCFPRRSLQIRACLKTKIRVGNYPKKYSAPTVFCTSVSQRAGSNMSLECLRLARLLIGQANPRMIHTTLSKSMVWKPNNSWKLFCRFLILVSMVSSRPMETTQSLTSTTAKPIRWEKSPKSGVRSSLRLRKRVLSTDFWALKSSSLLEPSFDSI